jgi:predicted acyl esterase
MKQSDWRWRRVAAVLGMSLAAAAVAGGGSTGRASAPGAEGAGGPGVTPPIYDFIIENGWLTMHDGVRLSVTYLKPTPRAPGETFPVLFDFYPYRKDEYPYEYATYFARRGYITALGDLRGTGSSEGVLPEREYSEQELDDAVEAIDLLSKIPGSNGRVGMWGKSWGGFNSIQVAMRRPPALKAILAVMATDDLYPDDVHHMEGAFHLDQFMPFMDNENLGPQTPSYPIDKTYFKNRFDRYPWFLTYAKHQRDGEFWRKNSLRFHYDRITIPCYLIGGLLDGYRDSIPRMFENMKAPIRAAIGPYKHDWPDEGVPGPNYSWQHEAVRWWDHWLKDRDTSVMNDPPLHLFVRDGHPPDARIKKVPGHWISTAWPVPGTRWRPFYPSPGGRLEARPGPLAGGEGAAGGARAAGAAFDSLRYVPTYGVQTGLWWGEPTGDMRPDDAGALVYEGPVLKEAFIIAGMPRVRLRISADKPLAHWMARLEDVEPDGAVSLVAGKLLNGSQRRSRLEPSLLEPGKVYDLEFDMHFTTWTFKPGHRVRLAVSNALWPMIWPTPYKNMTTRLSLGVEATRVELPVIPDAKYPAPRFLPPEPHDKREDARYLEGAPWPQGYYKWTRDLWDPTVSVEWRGYGDFETQGRRYHTHERNYYEANDDNPAVASFSGEAGRRITIGDRVIEITSTIDVRSDETTFHVRIGRTLILDGQLERRREWDEEIPREFM